MTMILTTIRRRLRGAALLWAVAVFAAALPPPEAAASEDERLEELVSHLLDLAIESIGDLDRSTLAYRQALEILQRTNVTDERIDNLVRRGLQDESATEEMQLKALDLLPQTTFSDAEQVGLLVDCLITTVADGSTLHRSLAEGLIGLGTIHSGQAGVIFPVSRLKQHPTLLAAELAKRMEGKNPPMVVFAAASLTGAHGKELLPSLIAAARSEDAAHNTAAFVAAGVILQAVAEDPRAADDRVKVIRSELTERELEYARRIIGRADKNRDGVLTPDEWKDMLVDPSAADVDGDGRITVEEFARWLKNR